MPSPHGGVCVIKADKELVCWHTSSVVMTVPAGLAGPGKVKAVSAGYYAIVCVIREEDSKAECFADWQAADGYPEIDEGVNQRRDIIGAVKKIAFAGSGHAMCLVKQANDEVECHGVSSYTGCGWDHCYPGEQAKLGWRDNPLPVGEVKDIT
eukprot:gene48416-38935_t